MNKHTILALTFRDENIQLMIDILRNNHLRVTGKDDFKLDKLDFPVDANKIKPYHIFSDLYIPTIPIDKLSKREIIQIKLDEESAQIEKEFGTNLNLYRILDLKYGVESLDEIKITYVYNDEFLKLFIKSRSNKLNFIFYKEINDRLKYDRTEANFNNSLKLYNLIKTENGKTKIKTITEDDYDAILEMPDFYYSKNKSTKLLNYAETLEIQVTCNSELSIAFFKRFKEIDNGLNIADFIKQMKDYTHVDNDLDVLQHNHLIHLFAVNRNINPFYIKLKGIPDGLMLDYIDLVKELISWINNLNELNIERDYKVFDVICHIVFGLIYKREYDDLFDI